MLTPHNVTVLVWGRGADGVNDRRDLDGTNCARRALIKGEINAGERRLATEAAALDHHHQHHHDDDDDDDVPDPRLQSQQLRDHDRRRPRPVLDLYLVLLSIIIIIVIINVVVRRILARCRSVVIY